MTDQTADYEITSPRDLAMAIIELRKQQFLGQVEVALLSNISIPVLNKIESGNSKKDISFYQSVLPIIYQLGATPYLKTQHQMKPVISKIDVAMMVKYMRKTNHLDQKLASELVGVSLPTLNKIEGPARDPYDKRDIRLQPLLKVLAGLGIKFIIRSPDHA